MLRERSARVMWIFVVIGSVNGLVGNFVRGTINGAIAGDPGALARFRSAPALWEFAFGATNLITFLCAAGLLLGALAWLVGVLKGDPKGGVAGPA